MAAVVASQLATAREDGWAAAVMAGMGDDGGMYVVFVPHMNRPFAMAAWLSAATWVRWLRESGVAGGGVAACSQAACRLLSQMNAEGGAASRGPVVGAGSGGGLA